MTSEQTKRFKYWQMRSIIATMVGYALFYFVRKNFSLAMPGLEADLGISKTSLGIFLTLNVDEEGTEFTVVFTPYSLFIIEEKEKPILHDFSKMDIKQPAKEVITDIESDIDTWSGFEASCDDATSISINRELITDLIDLIKRKI